MKFTEYVEVNPKTNLKKGEYAPFVEMANVSITYREPEKIENKKYTSGPKFQNGDSVVARIEPCLQNGKKFFWKSDKIGFGSTEYIVFRAKEGKMDSKYLFYLLKTDYIKKSMVSSMVGATGRQRVNNDIFGQIEIVVPNIEKQKKIGRTLFLYDDLIENNRKQIKLLEEAAQRLYKEWFVDLRFPGHENTKIVDGVPEGWNWCKWCWMKANLQKLHLILEVSFKMVIRYLQELHHVWKMARLRMCLGSNLMKGQLARQNIL